MKFDAVSVKYKMDSPKKKLVRLKFLMVHAKCFVDCIQFKMVLSKINQGGQ